MTEQKLNYCGYPATIKYIKADLKARGLNKAEIDNHLFDLKWGRSALNALNERRMRNANE